MDFNAFIQEGYAYITSAGISLGAIFAFLISWIRTRVRNVDKNELANAITVAKAELEVKLRKEYDAKFDAYQAQIVEKLTSLENKVIGKIDSNEQERKEEVRKQTLELEATIEAVNRSASIDEILNS